MPVSEEIRNEQRAAEVFDLAIAGLVVNCGVSSAEAASMLLTQAAKQLTPAGVKDALKAAK